MRAILHGVLDFFPLPMVLQFLSMNEKTGALALACPDKEVQIFFNHGRVVYAKSNQEKFRLGALLLRKHKIDSVQIKHIETRMLQENSKFGAIIVKEGIMTREEVQSYLKIQASEIIYDCFAWNHADFSFSHEAQIPEYAVEIHIDLTNLIMEGARRMDEFGYFKEKLPSKSAVYQVATNPDIQEKVSLSLPEWKILFLVNGKRTIDDICSESSEEELEVYKVVYGLYANKLIEVIEEKITVEEPAYTIQPTPAENLTTGIPVQRPTLQADVMLLISPQARLTWSDVVKDTLAQLQWEREDGGMVTFPLVEREYSIGRLKENAICLHDASVSSRHAKISRGADGYVLEDLSSTNGCFVNSVPITKQTLRHNDRIKLGTAELVYSVLLKGSR